MKCCVSCCRLTGRCPDGQTVTSQDAETPGIFDDLSREEIEAVVNYTRQVFCFYDNPDDENVTTIAVVELRPPTKHRAVQYLDVGGKAPSRNARVVLYRQVFLFATLTPL